MLDPPANPSYLPTASWTNLRRRAELLARTRQYFNDHGFLEVETPLLSSDIVVDRHLEPVAIAAPADPRRTGNSPTRWLQTSPEAAMKRMMAAGGESLYQITRSFRQRERGPWHNPEFTILEWYRRTESMNDGMEQLSDLCDTLLERGDAETLSYRDAFQRYAEIDPLTADTRELVLLAEANGLAAPPELGDDRDGWLELLLVELVQTHLGHDRPLILFDYPASQAALAAVRHEGLPVAERFELFVNGVELANGYHELTDPDELRRRERDANRDRQADGKTRLPGASYLLAAMDHGLPRCTGVALGFDRLVMLAVGATSIDEVIAFPIERA